MKYDFNPQYILFTDKYRVKEYAHTKGVKTAETFYLTDKPETMPFSELPANCFIKATHGWNWNILRLEGELYFFGYGKNVVDSEGNLKPKEQLIQYRLTEAECISRCQQWLTKTWDPEQWAYQYVEPRIMIEEMLMSHEDKFLKNYRLFTFHGEVKMVMIDSPQYKANKELVIVDGDWNLLQFPDLEVSLPKIVPKRPASFDEMLLSAKELVKDFDFQRVDFYDSVNGVVLGEITVYPGGGEVKNAEFNEYLGRQWK